MGFLADSCAESATKDYNFHGPSLSRGVTLATSVNFPPQRRPSSDGTCQTTLPPIGSRPFERSAHKNGFLQVTGTDHFKRETVYILAFNSPTDFLIPTISAAEALIGSSGSPHKSPKTSSGAPRIAIRNVTEKKATRPSYGLLAESDLVPVSSAWPFPRPKR